jgi:hypothetical protein
MIKLHFFEKWSLHRVVTLLHFTLAKIHPRELVPDTPAIADRIRTVPYLGEAMW